MVDAWRMEEGAGSRLGLGGWGGREREANSDGG